MPVRRLFLSVGAMKAGTTFLFNLCDRHPAVYFTPEKELHYFAHTQGLSTELQRPLVAPRGLVGVRQRFFAGRHDILTFQYRRRRLSMVMHNRFSKLQDADELREIVKWYSDRYLADPVDEVWFDRVFEAAGERWAADFSNYNALLDDAGWAAVRRHCEELRVLYLLRDPVKRLWSHMKFELLPSGGKDALTSGDRALVESFLSGPSSAHARYADIIKSLRRNLSSDELRIVNLESFVEDFPRSMVELEDFLGVEHFEYDLVDPTRKVNATEQLQIPEFIGERLLEVTRPQIQQLSDLGLTVTAG